ncbi:hypothetical protein, conserved [Eimeria tenella]|uniref:Uncharacterized protein n=1 Tax=Eimeria tenella TaxID=5802 RepID=U6KNQ4_EIMTE|nr:hypothetical protein, conserved [Eimeria tenella]CDJ38446.1 hypothetical protein, conserved [Eimeria tenella]|eukprot:XP_013229284.1 hypothetical protein, conserved [Eimeria tenella]
MARPAQVAPTRRLYTPEPATQQPLQTASTHFSFTFENPDDLPAYGGPLEGPYAASWGPAGPLGVPPELQQLQQQQQQQNSWAFEGAPKGPFPSPRRRAIFRSSVFAAVALLLCLGGLKAAQQRQQQQQQQQQQVAAAAAAAPAAPAAAAASEDAQRWAQALAASADELQVTWKRVSREVREAFVQNFSPLAGFSGESGEREALLLLQQQTEAIWSLLPREGASETQKTEFLLHAKLLQAVCCAAAARLRSLAKLEAAAAEGGPPVALLGGPPVRSGFYLGPKGQRSMTFREFLELLPQSAAAAAAAAAGADGEAAVPAEAAERLAGLLQVEEKYLENDKSVLEMFKSIGDLLELGFWKKGEEAEEFVGFLRHREKALENAKREVYFENPFLLLTHLKSKWKEEEVERLSQQLWQEQQGRLADAVRQKLETAQVAFSENSLFAFAIFLL